MKETGLMFKAPLVRSILDDSKTQTRRLVKPQPAPNAPHDGGTKWITQDGLHVPVGSVGHLSVREKQGIRCPMGQPGDRIYVRETYAHGIHAMAAARDEDGPFVYAADGTTQGRLGNKWTPCLLMPKYAARIWLDITGVRIERLQDISQEDAKAEGAWGPDDSIVEKTAEYFKCDHFAVNPKLAFRMLWESTGGDWAANPWVWVIDFKRDLTQKGD